VRADRRWVGQDDADRLAGLCLDQIVDDRLPVRDERRVAAGSPDRKRPSRTSVQLTASLRALKKPCGGDDRPERGCGRRSGVWGGDIIMGKMDDRFVRVDGAWSGVGGVCAPLAPTADNEYRAA
jgi:hypothetical protein